MRVILKELNAVTHRYAWSSIAVVLGIAAFLVNFLRFVDERGAEMGEAGGAVACRGGREFLKARFEPIDGPEKIDGCGAGASKRVADGGEFSAQLRERFRG